MSNKFQQIIQEEKKKIESLITENCDGDDAYTCGWEACQNGKSSDDNPYDMKAEFEDWEQWNVGYAECDDDFSQAMR